MSIANIKKQIKGLKKISNKPRYPQWLKDDIAKAFKESNLGYKIFGEKIGMSEATVKKCHLNFSNVKPTEQPMTRSEGKEEKSDLPYWAVKSEEHEDYLFHEGNYYIRVPKEVSMLITKGILKGLGLGS